MRFACNFELVFLASWISVALKNGVRNSSESILRGIQSRARFFPTCGLSIAFPWKHFGVSFYKFMIQFVPLRFRTEIHDALRLLTENRFNKLFIFANPCRVPVPNMISPHCHWENIKQWRRICNPGRAPRLAILPPAHEEHWLANFWGIGLVISFIERSKQKHWLIRV